MTHTDRLWHVSDNSPYLSHGLSGSRVVVSSSDSAASPSRLLMHSLQVFPPSAWLQPSSARSAVRVPDRHRLSRPLSTGENIHKGHDHSLRDHQTCRRSRHCAPTMDLLLRQGQPSWQSREQSVSSVCFFVLCNQHWFNRVPGAPPRDGLGSTYLPFTISSDPGYADLRLALLGAPVSIGALLEPGSRSPSVFVFV